MKAGNKIALALAASFVLCLAVLAAAFLCMSYLTKAKDLPENQVAFKLRIQSGDSAKKTAAILQENRIIKNKTAFYLLARFPKLAAVLTNESS